MSERRPSEGRGLVGVVRTPATVLFAASAVRHLGWWVIWQTRTRPTEGCRPASEVRRPGRRSRPSGGDLAV